MSPVVAVVDDMTWGWGERAGGGRNGNRPGNDEGKRGI